MARYLFRVLKRNNLVLLLSFSLLSYLYYNLILKKLNVSNTKTLFMTQKDLPNMVSSRNILERLSSLLHVDKSDWKYGLGPNSIAMVSGIIFKGYSRRGTINMENSTLFSFFLPSFCKTVSAGFQYHFYLAYDYNDAVLRDPTNVTLFKYKFKQTVERLCPTDIEYTLRLLNVPYEGKPTWAQSDAAKEAYIDGVEYIYRVNDDTIFDSPGWAEAFTTELAKFKPPFVGTVGPNNHRKTLTYEFVHRTHLDIFGVYYPRFLRDWFCDTWMTYVYEPNHMKMLKDIEITHQRVYGTRYHIHARKADEARLPAQVEKDKKTLQRYIRYRLSNISASERNGTNVISMSLYGDNITYTYGAIRNAQLQPVLFPGWSLRIYVEERTNNKYPLVPERILRLLKHLQVDVYEISSTEHNIAPKMWKFLVADDHNVDYFIIRDVNSRLSDHDFAVVHEWMKQNDIFNCVQDHRRQAKENVGGLWGGRPRQIYAVLIKPWGRMMAGYNDADTFLKTEIWPQVKEYAFCHDSVSNGQLRNMAPINTIGQNATYLGQLYDAYEQQID